MLTIWLLVAAFFFIDDTIARPINSGVREVIIHVSHYPKATEQEVDDHFEVLTPPQVLQWKKDGESREDLELAVRREKLEQIWEVSVWPLKGVGLFLAVVLIYMIGRLVGSFLGKRFYSRAEMFVKRVPVLRSVYPSIKKVTDFFVGERSDGMAFSRVVAVEYPRKRIWSIGLVTGETMRSIEAKAESECMTVFIPSAPTPFTGYVITVPVEDTIDLPISIDDAMRFTISGGVVVPDSELIGRHVAAREKLLKSSVSNSESDGDTTNDEAESETGSRQ